MLKDKEIIARVEHKVDLENVLSFERDYFMRVLARYARWLQKEESEKRVHQFWGELGAELGRH